MTLESIYFASQILSAIALVASLVYLGVQTKNNTLAVRQSAQQAMVADSGTLTAMLAVDAAVAALWVKGSSSYKSLTAEEKVRYGSVLHAISRNAEQNYAAYRAGNLDVEIWQGLHCSIQDICTSPGVQEWWKHRSHWYGQSFRELLNGVYATGTSTKYAEHFHDDPTNEI